MVDQAHAEVSMSVHTQPDHEKKLVPLEPTKNIFKIQLQQTCPCPPRYLSHRGRHPMSITLWQASSYAKIFL